MPKAVWLFVLAPPVLAAGAGAGALAGEQLSGPAVADVAAAVAVVVIALVFLRAAYAKLHAPDDAATAALLPPSLARVVARALPAVEIGLAAWLVSGAARTVAAVAALVLLLVFSAALLKLSAAGAEGCGCFGADERGGDPRAGVLRNALLIACAAAIAAHPQTVGLGSWGGGAPVAIVLAAAGLFITFSLAGGYRQLEKAQA